MKNATLHTKNVKTGKSEQINQFDIQVKDWGFSFFVETELDAFKVSHLYNTKKVGIEYSQVNDMFYITVYNENN